MSDWHWFLVWYFSCGLVIFIRRSIVSGLYYDELKENLTLLAVAVVLWAPLLASFIYLELRQPGWDED